MSFFQFLWNPSVIVYTLSTEITFFIILLCQIFMNTYDQRWNLCTRKKNNKKGEQIYLQSTNLIYRALGTCDITNLKLCLQNIWKHIYVNKFLIAHKEYKFWGTGFKIWSKIINLACLHHFHEKCLKFLVCLDCVNL